MANLGVPGQSTRSTAWSIAEHQVEFAFPRQISRVTYAVADSGQYSLHSFEPGRIDIARGNQRGRVSLGQDERFTAGGGTTIQNQPSTARQLCDQLRSLVLNASFVHLSADDPPGSHDELAWL
jgi:hypothetical protein